MTKRFVLQPAFVLHRRRYSETSLLVDLLTFPQGKVCAIARGSGFRGILRPFVPLLVTWSGKTELMNLALAEMNGLAFELSGHGLFSGIYLNELLLRLLQREDPHPELFMAYQTALADLEHCEKPERVLRLFEKELLVQLGYGFALDKEAETGEAIRPELTYYFDPQKGLYQAKLMKPNSYKQIFLGQHLLAFHANELHDVESLRAAKQLMRLAIEFLLGKSPKSRELFLPLA